VRHHHAVAGSIRSLQGKTEQELREAAKEMRAPADLIAETAKLQRLPVVNFAAGGIATPADAALMMQLGVDGVFVGSGIFKSQDPPKRAKSVVEAVHNFDDPKVLAEVSQGLGEAMAGIEIASIPKDQRLQERGW
jgi:pyridoxal 5'-phosphate synthase pdxS subunit